jgi:hypothetical protein
MPLSASVGTLGRSGERLPLAMPMTLTRPALICASALTVVVYMP